MPTRRRSSTGRKNLPKISSSLVLRLVCSGLEAGLVPADAVTRATTAFDQLRLHLRTTPHTPADQAWLEHMLCAALRSKGGETGYVLAVRVVETLRLIHAWQDKYRSRINRKGKGKPLPNPKPLRTLYIKDIARHDNDRLPLNDNDPMNERGLNE